MASASRKFSRGGAHFSVRQIFGSCNAAAIVKSISRLTRWKPNELGSARIRLNEFSPIEQSNSFDAIRFVNKIIHSMCAAAQNRNAHPNRQTD